MSVTISQSQRLYYFTPANGKGWTCIGFDVAEKRRRGILAWIGVEVPKVTVGTQEAFEAYQEAMVLGRDHAEETGDKCLVELEPRVDGFYGRRVEVRSPDGSKRRFNVGRSTGWMPCNIEIHNSRSRGGPSVYLAENDTVLPV
jgi:hypothetical protein